MNTNPINKTKFINFTRKFFATFLIYAMLIICLPFGTQINAQVPKPTAAGGTAVGLSAKQEKMKVSPDFQIAAAETFGRGRKSGVNQSASMSASSQPEGTPYLFANIEFQSPQARDAVFTTTKISRVGGVTVATAIDRFADVFIDSEAAYQKLLLVPGIVYISVVDDVVAPPPPLPVANTSGAKAVPDTIVRDGWQGLKGKNVVVAIIDTGVDFRHPDFITYDAAGNPTSRLLYLWDMGTQYKPGRGTQAPVQFPNKASIGTLYTQQQLTAELRSATTTIPATDLDGHGTACASIAAGNGNADMSATGLKRGEVVGVAPEAMIIGVSLDAAKNGGLKGAYLVNAINEWLDTIAGAKPLVVSNSWGGHSSGHDGQTVSERHANARYPLGKKGRAILYAAGNEAEDTFHATASFSGLDNPGAVAWSTEASYLRAYFNTSDINDISYKTVPGTTLSLEWAGVNPLTKQVEAVFKLAPGKGGMYIFNKSGTSSKVDLYFPPRSNSTFNPEVLSRTGLVGSPGTMENAITVGSYDWNDNFHFGGVPRVFYGSCMTPKSVMTIGGISCYSSPGPTRDGRMKPEIASPGQWFTSSAAMVNGASVYKPQYLDSTGKYARMNGTSAATPYTAGIVALMFQKKPTLTLGEVKNLLQANATKDAPTMTKPTAWGAGKLDVNAVSKIINAIK